jgi:predicted Zn-dependent peptidase
MKKKYYPQLDETVIWDVLPNGLTIAVVPKKGFQKKLAYFVTDYGSIHTRFRLDGEIFEAPNGVAHFLEHKMFDLPRGEISAEFAALGANPNAFTSYDMTAYYFSGAEEFQKNLELLLEFVSTPYFTEESVAKEQGIIGQEIDMVYDSPESRVFENLMEIMYSKHPVRVPILGTRETIGKITPEVLYRCHQAFYRPENMMLCVVGDVDAEAIRQTALRLLPETTAHTVEKETWQEPMTVAQPEITCKMEVAMPMFQLGFKCEPQDQGETAVRLEMVGDLAAEALFGESSALYLELYEKGLIDSSFGGGFESLDGMSMLTCSGDSEDPWAVRDAILDRARQLVQEGVAEDAFLRMKRSTLGRRIRDLDSFNSTCFRLCAYHFSKFDYMEFPRVFQDIRESEIREFLRQVVQQERCCLSVILPEDQED